MSTYEHPDRDEINYHAGTGVRHVKSALMQRSFKAIHLGVQFHQANHEADLLLAVFIQHMCTRRNVDISTVRCDTSIVKQEIGDFMTDKIDSFTVTYADGPFSSEVEDEVALMCICRSPWIEGSTFVVIYGEKQKLFNSHICFKCHIWYHLFCLSHCGVTSPKRGHDFLCPNCALPPTVPWTHPKYTNTCTSDNFLTILLLACLNNKNFINEIGLSEAECVIKAGISQMIKGEIQEGKGEILSFLQSKVRTREVHDCWGNDYDQCLTVLHHIWKLYIKMRCSSTCCPKAVQERYPVGFNIQPTSMANSSFSQQIAEQFPRPGQKYGYCGAKFTSDGIDPNGVPAAKAAAIRSCHSQYI